MFTLANVIEGIPRKEDRRQSISCSYSFVTIDTPFHLVKTISRERECIVYAVDANGKSDTSRWQLMQFFMTQMVRTSIDEGYNKIMS